MIPISRSLLNKIHDLLNGKMDPQHAEKVANDYNQFCEQIRARISQFSKLIREGNYYAALDVAQLEPTLTTQIERIRFPRESEWRRFLDERGIPCFEGFDDGEIRRVKEICIDGSKRQPSAYGLYRKAILLKNKEAAINQLRQLHIEFPKDTNARNELVRMEREVFESIDRELALLLRKGKEELIVQKVGDVLKQKWIIPLESDTWEKCLFIHDAHEQQKHFTKIVQSISQAKVIQRVGDWKDALPIVDRLKKAKDSDLWAELTAVQQNEASAILHWYEEREQAAHQTLKNQEDFNAFRAHLDPKLIETNLGSQSRKEMRCFKKSLEAEWCRFLGVTPELCNENQGDYEAAQDTIDGLLKRRSVEKNKLRGLWVPFLPVLLVVALLLFWINHRESVLGAEIVAFHKSNSIESVRKSIAEWDDFTKKFSSRKNPFRHHRAHQQVGEVNVWLNEIDLRHSKMKELLGRIEGSIHQRPDGSELRRMQLNLSIVADLLDKVPDGFNESLVKQYEALASKISLLSQEQLQSLRAELTAQLEALEQLMQAHFSPEKTHFENIQAEISEVNQAIDTLESKFRQSFDVDDIADLKNRLDESKKALAGYESSANALVQLEDRLRQSIALSEYLEYLSQISTLPFPRHPLVFQAIKLNKSRNRFDSLAHQLLLPGNATAWREFLKKADAPMVPEGTDPKESTAWRNLAGHTVLKDIYRYRLKKYKDGEQVGNLRLVYGYGEVNTVADASQVKGRMVSTLQEFDERYIGRGIPFTEKVYQCDTDANGSPVSGEFLEFDRLSPESGFYRQIEELCGFDASEKSLSEPLLAVLDLVNENEFISPIFKAWVTQELFNIMVVRAYDWGLNFCPSAQLDYKHLSKIKGRLYPYDWMRPTTQNRILRPLVSFYENQKELSYFQQAKASRELFRQVARQRVRYGGYVNENGFFMLLNATPEDRKLFGMRTDGSISILRNPGSEGGAPINYEAEPFSPIMFFNDPPEMILDRVTRSTGVDVNSAAFRPYLPEIFL